MSAFVLASSSVVASDRAAASGHAQPLHRRGTQAVQPYAPPVYLVPRTPYEGEDIGRSDDGTLYFPYTVSGINGI